MLGCPMDPAVRKCSWPGTRNWEIRSWVERTFSLGLFVSPVTWPPQTSFLPQHAHKGETKLLPPHPGPSPVLNTPQFECSASINKLLSALIINSLNGSRLAQIGQMPSLVCAVRSQGQGVGRALVRTGRSQRDQSLPNVFCLLALWQERKSSLFFP